MSSFKCKDAGMSCDFQVSGTKNSDETMKIVSVHARESHGMTNPPPEMAAKLQGAIRP